MYASKSLLDLVGMTQEQCSNFGWMKVLHPDDTERTIEAWKECVRTSGTWNIEHRFRGVDGQWYSVLARGVPVRNEKGEIIFWAGINLDISELKKAEVVLKERTRQLEEANRELESFSYSVSHDLRAPLRAIDGFSRKLEREYGDTVDEKFVRMINVIRSNTTIMETLIDDLLSFSKVQKAAMNTNAIDMNQLVTDVWNDVITANRRRELEVSKTKILPGQGDQTLIRQVLFNLLSNAVKFTKERKPGIIEISSYEEGDKIVYCVKDNGAGFDMEYYDKLFGVFQRLNSRDEYEGTGIGLAIVQRIVKRHGGDVWADGEVDKGATFYFSLPSKQTS
jgi:PAS domain S-box-containing protein